MAEYPKIETLFDRNEKFKVVPGQLRLPEFDLVNRWFLTEKIDGTNIRVEFNMGAGEVRLKGRTDNAQMPTFLFDYLVETFPADVLAKAFDGDASGTLYGEGYGPKIQKGGLYRSDGPSFRLFDVRIGDWWLNWPDVEDIALKIGVETVPALGECDDLHAAEATVRDLHSAVALAEGGQDHLAEGIVARTEPLLFTRSGARLMWKLKAKDFA